MSNFMKIRPLGAEVLHADAELSGQDMAKRMAAGVFFFGGDSTTSKFYVPTFLNILLVHTTYKVGTECSGTSAHKIQKTGSHPYERTQPSEHGESLKSRLIVALRKFTKAPKNKSHFPCLGVP